MKISQRTPVFLLLSIIVIALLSGCAPKQDAASEAADTKTGTPNPQFPSANDAEYAKRYNNAGSGGRH